MEFDKDRLAVEQNNYMIKIVNVSIVYDLYIAAINWIYSCYEITFGGAGSRVSVATMLEVL